MAFLRKVTTTLAVVAFLLQVAAIASPGWIIYIKGNIEDHHSLFYKRTCKTLMDETKCRVRSFHDLHNGVRDRLVKAKVGREKLASTDYEYHSKICEQVLVIVAVCLSMIMAVSQVIQCRKKDKSYQRLLVLSAATAATSAGMVIVVAFNKIVYIYYQIKLQSLDGHRDHTYMGFPYCVGMLLGSALLHCLSLMSISPQLHTPRIKLTVRKTYPDDDINDVPPTTVIEPVATVKKASLPPPPVKSKSVGHDNLVFSEKL